MISVIVMLCTMSVALRSGTQSRHGTAVQTRQTGNISVCRFFFYTLSSQYSSLYTLVFFVESVVLVFVESLALCLLIGQIRSMAGYVSFLLS